MALSRYKIEMIPGTYEVSAHYDFSTDSHVKIRLETKEEMVNRIMYTNYTNIAKSDAASSVDADVRDEMKKRERDRLLKEKMALVERFGADTFENGTVVKFSKKFNDNGITYDYAAIKADGKWFTTATLTGSSVFTWEEFLAWLVSGKFPATEFTLMVPMPAKVD